MQQQGHQLATARTGRSAIALVRQSRFDGVILDLDDSAYAVAQKLRSVLHDHSIIMLYTAKSELAFDVAHAAGIDMIVRKPVEAPALPEMMLFLSNRKLDILCA